MLVLADKDITYLKWLYNRLKYCYNAEDSVLSNLQFIISKLSRSFSIDIDKKDLDKIISKYYIDFYLDKGENNNQPTFGFNEQERAQLRNVIRNLVIDIINFNIKKDSQ